MRTCLTTAVRRSESGLDFDNSLNGARRALSWDVDNRLAAVTIQGGNSATYAYDSTGTRARKTTGAW